MVISGVDGAWGRDRLFWPFPALLPSGVGGLGGCSPQNRLCPLPWVPPVPPHRVGRSRAAARGDPQHRHRDTPEKPPLKEKKEIHLDCTLLLFIAYFVLSVVDNSLLSYSKKYRTLYSTRCLELVLWKLLLMLHAAAFFKKEKNLGKGMAGGSLSRVFLAPVLVLAD